MSDTNKRQAGAEIEVTPEMTQAAVRLVEAWQDENVIAEYFPSEAAVEDLATRLFQAMAGLAPTCKGNRQAAESSD